MEEKKYLEYRDNIENHRHLGIFKSTNEAVVIGRDGKMEELNVEVDSYHFDTLYERFSYLPGAVKQNEFKTACVAANAGFIILIVDANGFSIFLPDVFSIKQKEELLRILNQINSDYQIFAGIVSSKIASGEQEEFREFNDGEFLSIKNLSSSLEIIPVELLVEEYKRVL